MGSNVYRTHIRLIRDGAEVGRVYIPKFSRS